MGAKLHDFVARHLVMAVPDEMDACQECAQATCDGARFDACIYRRQRLAVIVQAREAGGPEVDPAPLAQEAPDDQ